MKLLLGTVIIFVSSIASGQMKTLVADPLTNLPLMPATATVIKGVSVGNEPVEMPSSRICRSSMKGNFYTLSNIKVDDVVNWYTAHLAGYKNVRGYESKRAQIVFYNSSRTILVIVTGSPGSPGENTTAYAVAYERYDPGLSEATVTSLTRGHIMCK